MRHRTKQINRAKSPRQGATDWLLNGDLNRSKFHGWTCVFVLGPRSGVGPVRVGFIADPRGLVSRAHLHRPDHVVMHEVRWFPGKVAAHACRVVLEDLAEHKVVGDWFACTANEATAALDRVARRIAPGGLSHTDFAAMIEGERNRHIDATTAATEQEVRALERAEREQT